MEREGSMLLPTLHYLGLSTCCWSLIQKLNMVVGFQGCEVTGLVVVVRLPHPKLAFKHHPLEAKTRENSYVQLNTSGSPSRMDTAADAISEKGI